MLPHQTAGYDDRRPCTVTVCCYLVLCNRVGKHSQTMMSRGKWLDGMWKKVQGGMGDNGGK